MDRAGHAIGIAIAVVLAIQAMPAEAQVRDAVYRGTMLCDKLPITEAKMREAIDVTIAGSSIKYSHVVRLRGAPEPEAEQGTGKLAGQDILLEGTWKGGGDREYRASYSGSFVRRSAKLKGTQTWTDGARTYTRACLGVIKRPFRIFLSREARKPTEQ
jgi:hypothetical protein